MLPVVDFLRESGESPILVLRDVITPQSLPRLRGVSVLQAPWVPPAARPRSEGADATMADILFRMGFGGPAVLRAILAAWGTLLDLLQPKAVITNYSPFANLACRGRCRIVVLGTGFTVPPDHLPYFPDPRRVYPESREREHQMLAAVNAALPLQQRLSSFPQVFSGDCRWVGAVPELDPYDGLRVEAAAGPLRPPSVPRAPRPRAALFAYLARTAPGFAIIREALRASGLEGRAYVKDGDDLPPGAFGALSLSREPLPVAAALEEAALVVHHGGLQLAQEALFAGVPQVLVPVQLEQALTAERLQGLGVGLIVPPEEPETARAVALLRRAAGDTARARQAEAWAARLHARHPDPAGLPPFLESMIRGDSGAS
jgi:rhamnosyltransferase subunit B